MPYGERRAPARPQLLYATRSHLAASLLSLSVFTMGGALWPIDPLTPTYRWWIVAGLLIGLGIAVRVVPDRPWTMPATLAGAVLGGGVLIASCRATEGMLVISLGLIFAAQFAAYALPTRAAVWILGLVAVTITGAMVLSPVRFHLINWATLLALMVLSSSLLGYVTHWLRRYATTDDLTGALSRAAFLDRLAAVVRDATRTGRPAALVSVDVDDFKEINDTRGHLAGDEILIALVEDLRHGLGRGDEVGRIGGDEFIVVLPGRTEDEARAWVARARAASQVRWSAGVVQLRPGEGLRPWVDRADAALYADKATRGSR